MGDVRAVLLAGGAGTRMAQLGAGRLKPLIPFGGSCRLVDFSIANAWNSGFSEVLLLSQHEERELMDDLFRVWWRPGFRVHFGPYDAAYRRAARDASVPAPAPPAGPPERGTADALIRKGAYIFQPDVTEVLLLHADHVYSFDYRDLIRTHRDSGAALTLTFQRIERRYVHLFGMVEFGPDGVLTRFEEKPRTVTSDLVFAAFCVFDAAILRRYLELLDGTGWQHDVSHDVIPAMLAGGELIRGYEVRGYWADIGTVQRYHRAHLSLVSDPPTMTLGEMPCLVAPAVARGFVRKAPGVERSIVPADLVNDGLLATSVAFPGVRIGAGAHVRDAVLLPGARIGPGAVVESAIVTEAGVVAPVAGAAVPV
ncbi:MAG TPA: sugar phosphate nucleotidyltransferase [Rugosimonospora sp.]|nr:sugar phosphate nucleotidyltransferase [Rugosimonospora sp.]